MIASTPEPVAIRVSAAYPDKTSKVRELPLLIVKVLGQLVAPKLRVPIVIGMPRLFCLFAEMLLLRLARSSIALGKPVPRFQLPLSFHGNDPTWLSFHV